MNTVQFKRIKDFYKLDVFLPKLIVINFVSQFNNAVVNSKSIELINRFNKIQSGVYSITILSDFIWDVCGLIDLDPTVLYNLCFDRLLQDLQPEVQRVTTLRQKSDQFHSMYSYPNRQD